MNPTLLFFKYDHLPEHLQEVSKPFSVLAHQIVNTTVASPEQSAGLRKLLEAKDCIVRSTLLEYKSKYMTVDGTR